jgi:hypothetical protein
MWICFNNAFISVVQKAGEGAELLTVRARRRGDIERVFPDAKVVEHTGTDYQFRAQLLRAEVADALVASVRAIDYSNFKDSVEDEQLHDAYMSVWSTMLRTQEANPFYNRWSQGGAGDLFPTSEDDEDDDVCPECGCGLLENADGFGYCPFCGYQNLS